MKILLIDDDLNTKNFLKVIEEKYGWDVTFSNHTIEQYKKSNYDMVIIDFIKFPEINNQILEINPNQKIIIIAEYLNCIDVSSCENCENNFNKKRLLKPIQFQELYDLLKNFDTRKCKYSLTDTFKNIKPILSDILRRFSYYEYNEEDLIYTNKEYSSSTVKELLDITSILDNYNLQYEVIEAKNIKLL